MEGLQSMGFFMARQHRITLVVVVVVRGGARRGRDDEADGFGDVRDIRTRAQGGIEPLGR